MFQTKMRLKYPFITNNLLAMTNSETENGPWKRANGCPKPGFGIINSIPFRSLLLYGFAGFF